MDIDLEALDRTAIIAYKSMAMSANLFMAICSLIMFYKRQKYKMSGHIYHAFLVWYFSTVIFYVTYIIYIDEGNDPLASLLVAGFVCVSDRQVTVRVKVKSRLLYPVQKSDAIQ